MLPQGVIFIRKPVHVPNVFILRDCNKTRLVLLGFSEGSGKNSKAPFFSVAATWVQLWATKEKTKLVVDNQNKLQFHANPQIKLEKCFTLNLRCKRNLTVV